MIPLIDVAKLHKQMHADSETTFNWSVCFQVVQFISSMTGSVFTQRYINMIFYEYECTYACDVGLLCCFYFFEFWNVLWCLHVHYLSKHTNNTRTQYKTIRKQNRKLITMSAFKPHQTPTVWFSDALSKFLCIKNHQIPLKS